MLENIHKMLAILDNCKDDGNSQWHLHCYSYLDVIGLSAVYDQWYPFGHGWCFIHHLVSFGVVKHLRCCSYQSNLTVAQYLRCYSYPDVLGLSAACARWYPSGYVSYFFHH